METEIANAIHKAFIEAHAGTTSDRARFAQVAAEAVAPIIAEAEKRGRERAIEDYADRQHALDVTVAEARAEGAREAERQWLTEERAAAAQAERDRIVEALRAYGRREDKFKPWNAATFAELIEHGPFPELESLPAVEPEGCEVKLTSSAMCERGTKGCEVDHGS